MFLSDELLHLLMVKVMRTQSTSTTAAVPAASPAISSVSIDVLGASLEVTSSIGGSIAISVVVVSNTTSMASVGSCSFLVLFETA